MEYTTKKSSYAILGLKPTASYDEIRRAYKKLVLKHHPDKGGDQAKFVEVREAFEILTKDFLVKEKDGTDNNGF
jgi:curved DNA-binding protein CbpA